MSTSCHSRNSSKSAGLAGKHFFVCLINIRGLYWLCGNLLILKKFRMGPKTISMADQRMLSGLDDFTDLDFGMESVSYMQ